MENTNHLQHRLRPFRDFVEPLRRNRHGRPLRVEADNQPDDLTDVQYCVTALPKDMSIADKNAQLSKLSDVVANIDNSDVMIFSMWIGA